jgi:hypothetical protein
VPAGFHDPIGLARRLIRTGDPAALFAMRLAALSPLALPVDLGLLPFERARYRRAAAPTRPILIVCGSARSGTTVAAQVLIRNLRLSYLDNFMSLFQRAPLTARAALGRVVKKEPVTYESFYGRTAGWSAPSDSLNLWDRWLGKDRTRAPGAIDPEAQRAMSAFFGALEAQTERPLLCKNNALNASAHLVAQALPTARFICIERSREALALSLLMARIEIHGNPRVPYGLRGPDAHAGDDPIEDVCRQVLYHEALTRAQAERLGPERFIRVQFEEICRDPRGFVTAVGQRVLGESPDFASTDPELGPFTTTPRPDTADLRRRIQGTFNRMAGSG